MKTGIYLTFECEKIDSIEKKMDGLEVSIPLTGYQAALLFKEFLELYGIEYLNKEYFNPDGLHLNSLE